MWRFLRLGLTLAAPVLIVCASACVDRRGVSAGSVETVPRPSGEVAPRTDGRAGADAEPIVEVGDASPADVVADRGTPAEDDAGSAGWPPAEPLSPELFLAALHERLAREPGTGRCGPQITSSDPAWAELLEALSGVVGVPFSPDPEVNDMAVVIPVDLTGDGDPEIVTALWFEDRGPEGTEDPERHAYVNSRYWLSVLRWTGQGYVATERESVGEFYFLDPCGSWEWRDLDGDGSDEGLAHGSESYSDVGYDAFYAFGARAERAGWFGAIVLNTGYGGDDTQVEGRWQERSDGPGLEYLQVTKSCEENCPDHDTTECWVEERRWWLADECLRNTDNYWVRCGSLR